MRVSHWKALLREGLGNSLSISPERSSDAFRNLKCIDRRALSNNISDRRPEILVEARNRHSKRVIVRVAQHFTSHFRQGPYDLSVPKFERHRSKPYLLICSITDRRYTQATSCSPSCKQGHISSQNCENQTRMFQSF